MVRLSEVCLLVGLLGFWGLEYSHVILQSDDLLNAGIAGRPDARMSLTEWWQLYRYDYLHVNGRFTDAAVRIVLQGGRTAWAILGPVLVVSLVVGASTWITGRFPGSRTPSTRAGLLDLSALALCAGVPLSIIALRPAAAGDAIFWLSAALTHLGSAVCILVGGWPFLATVLGRRLPRPAWFVAPPFMVLANISQETASVAMLVVVASCAILLRGRVGRHLGILSAVSVLAFAYQVFSPGLVGRATQFQAQAGESLSLVQQLLHRGVVSAQIWLTMAAAGIVGVLVLATVLLWIGVRAGSVARWPAVGLSMLAAFVLGAMTLVGPWSDTFEVIDPGAFAGPDVSSALVLVASIVGACLFGMSATYVLRHLAGPVPFVLMASGAAALAVPTSLGITGERAYLISSLWWGFTAICLLVTVARTVGPLGAPSAAGAAAVALLALIPTAREINLAMVENYATWQHSADQIAAAPDTGSATVTVGPFPYPAYMCWAAFDEARYGDYFRLYYDIPPEVRLIFRPSAPVS